MAPGDRRSPESRRVRSHVPVLGALFTLAVLVVWTLIVAMFERTGFESALSYFGYSISAAVPVAYPFLVLLPVVVPLGQQLQKRWVVYTRTRIPIARFLARVAVLNAVLAFVVFFVYIILMFLLLFVGGESLGAVYDPGAYSHPPGSHMARLTALAEQSPTIYALVYAGWHGLNAAVWATVGFVAVVVIRRRIIAFAVPFMLFALLSMVMGVLGVPFAWNTPWLLWVLFSVSDVPFLPSVLTLAVFALAAVLAVTFVIRRADRLPTLQ